MPDSAGMEKEKHMKQLKRRMECWREVILPLNSILLWERSWYPGLIVGLTTTIFFIVWLLEPAVLTIISVCLLVLALVDYLVPLVTSLLCPADNWTGQKEKKLNEICQNVSTAILQIQNVWKTMVEARNKSPNTYYGAITTLLLCFAWIGNIINNLLLFYVAVNVILLMPGFRHKGRVRSALREIYNYFTHPHLS